VSRAGKSERVIATTDFVGTKEAARLSSGRLRITSAAYFFLRRRALAIIAAGPPAWIADPFGGSFPSGFPDCIRAERGEGNSPNGSAIKPAAGGMIRQSSTPSRKSRRGSILKAARRKSALPFVPSKIRRRDTLSALAGARHSPQPQAIPAASGAGPSGLNPPSLDDYDFFRPCVAAVHERVAQVVVGQDAVANGC